MSNQFQYQPINFQNKTTKSPNFLNISGLFFSKSDNLFNLGFTYQSTKCVFSKGTSFILEGVDFNSFHLELMNFQSNVLV